MPMVIVMSLVISTSVSASPTSMPPPESFEEIALALAWDSALMLDVGAAECARSPIDEEVDVDVLAPWSRRPRR